MSPLDLANRVLRGGGLRKFAGDTLGFALADTARDIKAAADATERFVSPEQGKDGTYAKGRLEWFGLPITIETPAGAFRQGRGWSSEVQAHYGEVEGTTGADGDPIDVFLKPQPECSSCLVIYQRDPHTLAFDEHKVMLGWKDAAEALQVYTGAFSDGLGHQRIAHIRDMSLEAFKEWMRKPDLPSGAIMEKRAKGSPLSEAEHAQRVAAAKSRWRARMYHGAKAGLTGTPRASVDSPMYLTSAKKYAQQYAGRDGVVHEFAVSPKAVVKAPMKPDHLRWEGPALGVKNPRSPDVKLAVSQWHRYASKAAAAGVQALQTKEFVAGAAKILAVIDPKILRLLKFDESKVNRDEIGRFSVVDAVSMAAAGVGAGAAIAATAGLGFLASTPGRRKILVQGAKHLADLIYNPTRVGATPTYPAIKRAMQRASHIHGRERLIVLDPKGKVIDNQLGGQHNVKFSDEMIDGLVGGRTKVGAIIHNHPPPTAANTKLIAARRATLSAEQAARSRSYVIRNHPSSADHQALHATAFAQATPRQRHVITANEVLELPTKGYPRALVYASTRRGEDFIHRLDTIPGQEGFRTLRAGAFKASGR